MNDILPEQTPAWRYLESTLVSLLDLDARELPIHADVLGATLALAPEQRVKLSGPAPLTLELQSLSA